MKPRMVYFGPYEQAGHHFFNENGTSSRDNDRTGCPWTDYDIDGVLQPGCFLQRGYYRHGIENEGEALVHHKDGWTALSFWDRSVDMRGACNSTYIAEGTFTFDEIVEMAKTRFAKRWSKMKFAVVEFKG